LSYTSLHFLAFRSANRLFHLLATIRMHVHGLRDMREDRLLRIPAIDDLQELILHVGTHLRCPGAAALALTDID